MTVCIVEEENPPEMEDYCKNYIDANDKDPEINWYNCWNKEDTHQHTYSEEHVQWLPYLAG
jgi:hypothetical protein